jgi:hypothetical protein
MKLLLFRGPERPLGSAIQSNVAAFVSLECRDDRWSAGRAIPIDCDLKLPRYSAVMTLKCMTYTSLAQLDLAASDLENIHRTARHANGLNGITGLLIFNGTHFLQVIEGTEDAVDALVEHLRRDQRHTGFEIRDISMVEERSFPNWSMELVRISASYFEAKDNVADRLPAALPSEVRDRVLAMTKSISATLSL